MSGLRRTLEHADEATATLLDRLARLRDEQVINAAEFERLKGALLSHP